MNVLVSAPLDFINNKHLNKYKNYNFIFDTGKNKSSLNKINKKNLFGWIVNPCPEYFIDKNILKGFDNLKIIVTPSTGSTHIDTKYCKNMGIKVKTLRDSPITKTITASSEFTLLLLLSVIRKFPIALKNIKNNNWRINEDKMRGREISNLKIGIVGLGRIGGNVANYLYSMGAEINFYDPYVINKKFKKHIDLYKMLNLCDVVLTCVHVSNDTIDMVNKKFFQSMKDNSYFINTSRGEIVVDKELINALNSGKILSAGLDVIRDENSSEMEKNLLIKYSKKNSNLIITPHIAGLTIDSETKAQLAAFDLVDNELK